MMTLNDLTFALFRGNIRKYRLFVICNACVIGMLLSLRLLLDNPYLNDPEIVDPMISSNVFAPTLFMHFFVAFFIPYTTIILNRQVQKNYGILLAMGLGKNQFIRCILLEHTLLFLISLVGGIGTGTILEYLLIRVIRHILESTDLMPAPSVAGVLQTILFIMIIYTVLILSIIVQDMRKSILDIITEERKTEYKKEHRIVFAVGIILFVSSLFVSYLFYEKTEGNILLVGIVTSFGGIILMWFNMDWILKRWRRKDLFLISDYLYYFKTNAKLGTMLAGLFGVFIFMNTISLVTESSLKNDVKNYYPYDLVYSLEEGEDGQKLLSELGVSVEEMQEISYFYAGGHAVLGVDDVNEQTHNLFEVPEKRFLFVRSIVLNDGYPHERGYVPEWIEIDGQEYQLHRDIDCLLFGRGGGLTDNLILLNQKDYETIINTKEISEFLYLCNVDQAIDQAGLAENIKERTGSDVLSYYEAHKRAERSAELLYFLLGYVSLIILLNALLSIHYKRESEREKDKEIFRMLYLFGAEKRFLRIYKGKKLFYSLFVPFVVAMIWISIITYINTFTYEYQKIAISKCCSIGCYLGIFLMAYYLFTVTRNSKEEKQLCKQDGLLW